MSAVTAAMPPTSFIGKEELLKEDMETSFLTNVLGPWYTINAFLELVRTGETKKIIVTSTGMSDPAFAEIAGIPGAAPYT